MSLIEPRPRLSFRTIKEEITRSIGTGAGHRVALFQAKNRSRRNAGSRATVNRALQELARAGLVERKRKVGTRVVLNPVREARFAILVVRQEVAASGAEYGYRLLSRQNRIATARTQSTSESNLVCRCAACTIPMDSPINWKIVLSIHS
nr:MULTISPECIES: GntR family transcriptional regulator [unclassified Rhizobium]